MNQTRKAVVVGTLFALMAVLLAPSSAVAHCDGMDGPVVQAARDALAEGEVNLVLIWVQKGDEPEIQRAFVRTLEVRKLGPEAKELADRYFFETLVRTHRAGEGAPYTGLKPAGRDLGPAIPLADEALTKGSVDALVKLLTDEIHERLTERFGHAMMARKYSSDDVAAGRAYVRAYVRFVHYVEGTYAAASEAAVRHDPENEHALERHHE